MYIHIYKYIYVCIYLYVPCHVPRRGRWRRGRRLRPVRHPARRSEEMRGDRCNLIYICIHIYIYIYIYKLYAKNVFIGPSVYQCGEHWSVGPGSLVRGAGQRKLGLTRTTPLGLTLNQPSRFYNLGSFEFTRFVVMCYLWNMFY